MRISILESVVDLGSATVGAVRQVYGSETIRTALPLVLASAVIVLPVSASAITPQQCQVLNTSFLKLMKYQGKVLDQSEILLQQRLDILSLISSIRDKHPELTKSDFTEFEKVGERVVNAAGALNPGSDLAALNQSAADVLADLCP